MSANNSEAIPLSSEQLEKLTAAIAADMVITGISDADMQVIASETRDAIQRNPEWLRDALSESIRKLGSKISDLIYRERPETGDVLIGSRASGSGGVGSGNGSGSYRSDHPSASSQACDYATHGELEFYLRADRWSEHQIPALLADIDPERSEPLTPSDYVRITTLGGARYSHGQSATDYDNQKNRIQRLWRSCMHDPSIRVRDKGNTTFPVGYCIQWAQEKRILIPWLEWATENDLLPDDVATDTELPTRYDHPAKDSSCKEHYAHELHAALEVWEALYLKGEKPQHLSHTAAANSWLKKQWPHLGDTAREQRIARVTNPSGNKNSGK